VGRENENTSQRRSRHGTEIEENERKEKHHLASSTTKRNENEIKSRTNKTHLGRAVLALAELCDLGLEQGALAVEGGLEEVGLVAVLVDLREALDEARALGFESALLGAVSV
jgi:hypothetical protein